MIQWKISVEKNVYTVEIEISTKKFFLWNEDKTELIFSEVLSDEDALAIKNILATYIPSN